MKYRKKPVVIESIQWEGTAISLNAIMDTFKDIKWTPGEMGSYSFNIETLEGPHIVSKGDFIIKGVKGEYYPCKPDIFEMTYEKMEDQ